MFVVIGLLSCHQLGVIPGTGTVVTEPHNYYITVVQGLVECRVKMECTFEILNLRKFPLVVGTNEQCVYTDCL